MKNELFFLLFLLTCTTVHSQDYINKKKTDVVAYLKKKYQQDNSEKTSIIEEKDTVRLQLKDPANQLYDYLLAFDGAGSCKSETIMTRCDSCLAVLVQQVLAKKKYKWKQLNENQYVSRFEDNLMIELPADNTYHSFSVLRVEWTKELYKLLLKQ